MVRTVGPQALKIILSVGNLGYWKCQRWTQWSVALPTAVGRAAEVLGLRIIFEEFGIELLVLPTLGPTARRGGQRPVATTAGQKGLRKFPKCWRIWLLDVPTASPTARWGTDGPLGCPLGPGDLRFSTSPKYFPNSLLQF